MKRWIDANAWTVGLAALLAALLLATKLIQPDFGATGLDSLARAALPFALATVGMAIVVLAGGIEAGRGLWRNNTQTPEPTPFTVPRREGRALNKEAEDIIGEAEEA